MRRGAVMISSLGILLVLCRPTLSAPGPREDCPLRFTAAVDRKEYLPQEAIILEWALTNVGATTLTVPEILVDRHLSCSCVVKGRVPYLLRVPGIGCGEPPELIPLGPGKSLRGWLFFNSHWTGWPARGEFKVKVACSTAYSATWIDEFVHCRLEAEELPLKIVEPVGRDAAAHRLIRGLMENAHPGRFVDDSPRLDSEDTGENAEVEREYALGLWVAASSVRSALLEKVKSSRYHPQVLYDLGVEEQSDSGRGATLPAETVDRAVNYLTACLDCDACSPFMRAIVLCERAKVLFRSPRKAHVAKAEQDALAVTREFPHTAFADKARRLLRSR